MAGQWVVFTGSFNYWGKRIQYDGRKFLGDMDLRSEGSLFVKDSMVSVVWRIG